MAGRKDASNTAIKNRLMQLEEMNDAEIQSHLDLPHLLWKKNKIADPKNLLEIVRKCCAQFQTADDPMKKILASSGMAKSDVCLQGVDLYEFGTWDRKELSSLIVFIILSCVME